ncbi:MAG TPA: POTRA domain-containing protein [Trueperaceae bacterium]
MSRTRLFALLAVALTLCSWAAAQPKPTDKISEIRIIGTDNDILRNLITVKINARPGTPVGQIDLEAERNRVATIGEFASVSVSIEDRGNGPILLVRVVQNPPVAEVAIEGSSLPVDRLLEILDQQNLVHEGAIYNSLYARDAINTLQKVYRANGWPLEVPVDLSVTPVSETADEGREEATRADTEAQIALQPGEKTPVKLTYTVTENVPLDKVDLEASQVLPQTKLQEIFAPLERSDTFDYGLYLQARDKLQQAYQAEGYRLNKLDSDKTLLQDGVLHVALQEVHVTGFDTDSVGIDAADLSLKPGDPYDYDVLLADIRRLANGRESDLRFTPLMVGPEAVRVIFQSGPPESAGPVQAINIEGNTVFSDERIKRLLSLHVGDTFTSALATEDFRRIQQLYNQAGYRLVVPEDLSTVFGYSQEGTYVQRLQEVMVAGYDVRFAGGQGHTDPTVITRYLPDPGTVFNMQALQRGLLDVTRLGIVDIDFRRITLASADPLKPAQATVVIPVQERRTGTFSPALTYATDTGLSATVSYSDTNLFGRAHNFSADITAQTSDIGFLLGGGVSYSIPWLYIDFLDFKEVPTSVSAEIFSRVSTNQALTANGSLTTCFDPSAESCPDEERVQVGEYALLQSCLSFSVGRPVFTNTSLRFSASGSYADYTLEPPADVCTRKDGRLVPPGCSISADRAAPFLPQSGLSSLVQSSLTYSTRNDLDFPTAGLTGTASVGVGFGSDYRNPDTGLQQGYVYEPVELSGTAYLKLEDVIPEVASPSHVLAFKVSFGHQFGHNYPDSKKFSVGDVSDPMQEIRGYTRDDFNPSQTYVTGSMEYRYDFGVDTFLTKTIIGMAFVDVGYASSVPGFEDYATPLFAGAGLGVQLNLDPGGIFLPLRLQYAFSERHPGGVLRLRVGGLF